VSVFAEVGAGVGVDLDMAVEGDTLSFVSDGKVSAGVGADNNGTVGVGGMDDVCCDEISPTIYTPAIQRIIISIMPTSVLVVLPLTRYIIMLTIIAKMATIICQAVASMIATFVFRLAFGLISLST